MTGKQTDVTGRHNRSLFLFHIPLYFFDPSSIPVRIFQIATTGACLVYHGLNDNSGFGHQEVCDLETRPLKKERKQEFVPSVRRILLAICSTNEGRNSLSTNLWENQYIRYRTERHAASAYQKQHASLFFIHPSHSLKV